MFNIRISCFERLHLYKGDPESLHEAVAFEPSLDGFKVS